MEWGFNYAEETGTKEEEKTKRKTLNSTDTHTQASMVACVSMESKSRIRTIRNKKTIRKKFF